MTPEVPLPRQVALRLLHALIDDCARTVDADVLVIKGLAYLEHGYRDAWTSSDVDVLVAPRDADRLGAELVRRGWQPRLADEDTRVFPRHSTSFFHRAWPCDIDLHDRYPGIERDPGESFDLLFAQRTIVEVAERTIAVAGAVDSAIVDGLHALRTPSSPRYRERMARATRSIRTVGASVAFDRAVELGAQACLRPLLQPILPDTPRSWGTPSEEWTLRSLADPLARRVAVFVLSGRADRARALRAALWPRRSTLAKDIVSPAGPPARILVRRLRRWARGTVALPRAIGAATRFLRTRDLRDTARSGPSTDHHAESS